MGGNGLFEFLKSLKVERTGVCGGNQKMKFDDSADVGGKIEAAGPIKAIKVRSGYILDAIGVVYEGGETHLHGNARGGTEAVIPLEGDSIKSIHGQWGVSYCGSAISKLVIVTKNGKTYGPYGTGYGGRDFELTLPGNAWFAGFFGTADSIIVESLGMLYIKGTEKNANDMPGESETKCPADFDNLF